MKYYPALLFIVAIILAGTAGVAGAQCTVYEHENYEGRSEKLGPDNSVPLMQRWNDRISSIDVSRGCRLTAFEHKNFTGDSKTFGAPNRYVGDLWNDRISSMQCNCDYQPSRAMACELYEDANFSGDMYSVEAEQEDADLWRNFNDKASSVVVPRNCELWVFEHKDFVGRRKPFGPGSYPYVGNYWNDRVSSAACRCNISSWR